MRKQSSKNQFKQLMQKQFSIEKFTQDLKNSSQNLLPYIQILINPISKEDLTQKSKYLFGELCKVLRSDIDKSVITRIAKFTLLLIMTGHFHILRMFDIYMLTQIVAMTTGILKLQFLTPITEKSQEVDPIKWKTQFANQILHILAHWFPYNLVQDNGNQQRKLSMYSKIVQSSKIKLKGFFIFSIEFISNAQIEIEQLNKKQQKCQYCITIYDQLKVKSKLKSNVQKNKSSIQEQDKPKMQLKLKQNSQPNFLNQQNINSSPFNNNIQLTTKRESQRIRQKLLLNKNKKMPSRRISQQKSKSRSKSIQKQKIKIDKKQDLKNFQTFGDNKLKEQFYRNNNSSINDRFAAKIVEKSKRRKIQLK